MTMGVISENGLTIVGIISGIVLLSSLTLGFVLHDDEQLSFSIDDDSIMNDINAISSMGPRVAALQKRPWLQHTSWTDLLKLV